MGTAMGYPRCRVCNTTEDKESGFLGFSVVGIGGLRFKFSLVRVWGHRVVTRSWGGGGGWGFGFCCMEDPQSAA